MTADNQKEDFPIFINTPHVYLDSAATTHKPQMVIDAISNFYSYHYGTVRRGLYRLSAQATRQFEETRSEVARFIGSSDHTEIVFTSGTTESISLVAQSYLSPLLQAGDEIIISQLEHHANFIPWQQLAREKNARLIILPLDANLDIDLQVYKNSLSHKTRLVAITHISNVTGGINPVKKMTDLAHEYGARILIDGAQSIAHLPVNVHELNCDFFAFSGHKLYGPTGIGVLYGKKEILDEMPPYRFGGEMILEVTNEYSNFKKSPQRFEAGTPNIAGVIGLGAAIRFIQSISLDRILQHEKDLTDYLFDQLKKLDITILGNSSNRSSLISFLIDDIHPHDAGTILDSANIAVRAGHHCAQPLMRFLKIPASVRASVGWYNDQKDIDDLVKGIIKVRMMMQ